MAVRDDIESGDHWFIGEDREFEFEVLSDDGLDVDDPLKVPYNVTGLELAWALNKTASIGLDPALILKRTTTGGITITGTYNVSRAVNTQRVIVAILDSDTDDLKPTGSGLTYSHALKRMTDGAEKVLTYGLAYLHKAATPRE